MQTVLITGISKGIGLATAQQFLDHNFEVMGTTLDGTAPFEHDHLSMFQLDLSAPESIAQCIQTIAASGKKIDILIHNAGALFDEDETSVKVDLLRKTLEVNLIGTIDLTEQLISSLNNAAHIVMISSTAGSLERTGAVHGSHYPRHYPSYKISKAALNMYMRTLALRLKGQGIIVSSVHPGWVQTDMGGPEADITPDEAAQDIFAFAITQPETGHFWFKGEMLPW